MTEREKKTLRELEERNRRLIDQNINLQKENEELKFKQRQALKVLRKGYL